MKARIVATLCKGKDLKPGDLFSTIGQDYWDGFGHLDSIGERVYIRTNTPAYAATDATEEIYRIEVVKEG